SPIEPLHVKLPYERLGPEAPEDLPPSVVQLATDETMEIEADALDRLRLGPPPMGAAIVTLDLIESLEYGTHHSRSYASQMEDLYLAALDVTLARHLYEPRPFAYTGFAYSGTQKEFNYQSALTATATAGVKQQLPYGGEVTAQGL